MAIWPRDKITIAKGEDQIDSYPSSEGHQRAWCKKCGGHVFHDVGPLGVVDVYASLVQGLEFKPTLHFNYESTIMPMKDGLPKFKDFPSDFGGSGETLPEVSSIHQRWLFALMSALDIFFGKALANDCVGPAVKIVRVVVGEYFSTHFFAALKEVRCAFGFPLCAG